MAVSNTKQLFTLSEAEECVRLVCKARQAGAASDRHGGLG